MLQANYKILLLLIKFQNKTNLPAFNSIYIRKESVNYKCKCTFNSYIIF